MLCWKGSSGLRVELGPSVMMPSVVVMVVRLGLEVGVSSMTSSSSPHLMRIVEWVVRVEAGPPGSLVPMVLVIVRAERERVRRSSVRSSCAMATTRARMMRWRRGRGRGRGWMIPVRSRRERRRRRVLPRWSWRWRWVISVRRRARRGRAMMMMVMMMMMVVVVVVVVRVRVRVGRRLSTPWRREERSATAIKPASTSVSAPHPATTSASSGMVVMMMGMRMNIRDRRRRPVGIVGLIMAALPLHLILEMSGVELLAQRLGLSFLFRLKTGGGLLCSIADAGDDLVPVVGVLSLQIVFFRGRLHDKEDGSKIDERKMGLIQAVRWVR